MAKKTIKFTPANFWQAFTYAGKILREFIDRGNPFNLTIQEPTRSDRQNALLHAQISDISKQLQHLGQNLPLEFWKAGLVDLFEQAKLDNSEKLRFPSEIMPALDNSGRFISLRASTAKFSVKEANEFIEFLFLYGAENGVKFADNTYSLRDDLGG